MPSTVLASTVAVRRVQGVDQFDCGPRGGSQGGKTFGACFWRSRGSHAVELESTVQDAASTVTEHRVIGSPVGSDHEASNGEVSTQVEIDDSTSETTLKVFLEIAEPIIEEDPVMVEGIAPSRALGEAPMSLDTVDVMHVSDAEPL